MKPGFLWGVATSAFQLEGSPRADWARWDPILLENPRLTDHYRRYKQDLQLLKNLGVNAYRFSIEWSRIEPAKGCWDEKALRRYQDIVTFLLDSGIEPVVTLHHFTNPQWFTYGTPWHHPSSVDEAMRFVVKVILAIPKVRYWITFNEPNIFILGGYIDGSTPPGIRDWRLGIKALVNIMRWHRKVYDLIHSRIGQAMVGIAHNMAIFAPWGQRNILDRMLVKTADDLYNRSILEAFKTGTLRLGFPLPWLIKRQVPIKGKIDFLGINYYTRVHLKFDIRKRFFIDLRHVDRCGNGLTDTGWEIYPLGLDYAIRRGAELGVPIMITENGIATSDSLLRIRFLQEHVAVLENCCQEGMDVRGYFYWSFLDNYEWLRGFKPRFGLYEIDYSTMQRFETAASNFYASLVKSYNW